MTSGNGVRLRTAGGPIGAGLRRYWYPLAALVRRDLKKRYATSMLGIGWTILHPAILMALYTVVFGFIFRSGRPAEGAREFVLYLLSGMLPYISIAEAVHASVASLREDRALLERETFPAEVVPAARVLTASVGEAVGLLLVVLLAPFFGLSPTPWILALPLLILVRVLLTLGLAWAVSVLSIFVSDLTQVLSLLLTSWLFLTPIFYTADAAPPILGRLMVLNPLHAIVRAYRSVLIEGQAPWSAGLVAIVWATLFAGVGLWFFRKTLDRAKDFL